MPAALAHTMESLATAAATLAEAAQAMSIAARLFSSEVLAERTQQNKTPVIYAKGLPIATYESDSDVQSSSTQEEQGVFSGVAIQQAASESEEWTNPDDSDYYTSEGDVPPNCKLSSMCQTANVSTADQHSNHPFPSPGSVNKEQPESKAISPITMNAESEVESGREHHLLLDYEADVLPSVCALIRERQKVICYMTCAIPVLNLYKELIANVTQAVVSVVSSATPEGLEKSGKAFLQDQSNVLLLPDNVCPGFNLAGTDSWVLHVGWPADDNRYKAQIEAHGAQNNILIACSGDKSRYPIGAAVVSRSQPWPGNSESFRISVAVLRPLFKEKLSSQSPETKAKVYTDWITCHGAKGHRYVPSWTPIDLVYHANLYLLDVLGYHTTDTRDLDPMQAPLPGVSPGFVIHNGLQSAVEEGVLRLKSSGSSLNQISLRSKGDNAPSGSISLNEGDTPRSISRQELAGSIAVGPVIGLPPVSTMSTSTAPAEISFKSTLGHTHFAIAEEFDAIPLIGLLVVSSGCEKTIIHLDSYSSLPHYKHLVEKLTGYRYSIISPQVNPDEQNKSNQEAALQFIECPSQAVLLLPYRLTKLPPALAQSTIGLCIYWGAGGFVPVVQAKRDRGRFNCASTCVIMTKAQMDTGNFVVDTQEHPSSSDLLDSSRGSWLSPMRENTRSALTTRPDIAKGLYSTYFQYFAKLPRTISSIEVARRLNHFSAKILLRGNLEDGSRIFPPIGGRYPVSIQAIKDYDLQPAVDAGLIVVG